MSIAHYEFRATDKLLLYIDVGGLLMVYSDGISSETDSKVHGAHLRPTGHMWAPCWPRELCYLGRL